MKRWIGIALAAVLICSALMAGCSDGGSAETGNPVVSVEMENGEKFQVELYPNIAPNTVRNFISLVQKGFYDGLSFHRVETGALVQGGDPEGTGIGGPGYTIKGEFTSNGVDNSLSHTEGVISMARTMASNDTAGSQFFICLTDLKSLDGYYASFGKVISGMETVRKIAAGDVMKKVTVDTKGVTYEEPETLGK